MAFEYMKYKQGISYIGVDNNVYWRKIHNFIKENFKGGGVKFKRNIDVLTYFEKNELHKCNVIIIQYLISFFFETIGEDGIRKWFSCLAEKLLRINRIIHLY